MPHEVSKGAQKNFSGFASELGRDWDRNDGTDFNELWFKRLIGKAILFRQLDARVLRANWYVGYKANIVTYALAKFSQLVHERGVYIDLLKIWNLQLLPEELTSQLLGIAEGVHTILLSRPGGITSNVSEWAKSEECWGKVRSEKMPLGAAVREYFLDRDQNEDLEKDAGRTDIIQGGIQDQTYVLEKGAAYWQLLRDWNSANRKLTAKEIDIVNIACSMPKKIPSEKQSLVLIGAENRAKLEGFFPG
jgi:hypothetical protein